MRTHNVNKNKWRYYRIEHAGHKSKSGRPVRPYSTSGTLLLLFVKQTCHNIARISSTSLVHWMHGWAIPQDNRMVHEIWSDKTNFKTASIFQIMHRCCVLIRKLVNTALNTLLKFFILWEYIFKTLFYYLVCLVILTWNITRTKRHFLFKLIILVIGFLSAGIFGRFTDEL